MVSDPAIASAPLRTLYGDFELYVFSWSDNEQDNVLVLRCGSAAPDPLVRIQSACYTGEIFDSLDCDCHWQLETSLNAIQREGGAFIYMLRDGRGAGLLAKIRGMSLSHARKIDTADAYEALGIAADPRDYDQAVYVLNFFNMNSVRLLTNNPRKQKALIDAGIGVARVSLESEPTPHNKDYLQAKATKLGHLMRRFGTG